MISIILTEDISIKQYLDQLGYMIGESEDFELYDLVDSLNETEDINIFTELFDSLMEATSPLMEATSPYNRNIRQKVIKHIRDFAGKTGTETAKQFKRGHRATASVTNDFETKNRAEDGIRHGINALGGVIRAGVMGPRSIARGLKKGLKRSTKFQQLKSKYHDWRRKAAAKKGNMSKFKHHNAELGNASKQIQAIERTKRIKSKVKNVKNGKVSIKV